MHIALRPYVTTGIAIVGASIIAVAPVAVPPPDVPTIEVAAADTVRSMTTDLELTALVDLIAAVPAVAALVVQQLLQSVPLPAALESFAIDFILAGVPAVAETFKLWTETVPTTALNLIASGQFAHLAVLAADTVYQGTLTPIAPFLVEILQAIPLPLGTLDGVLNELLVLGVQTPFLAGNSVLTLLAQAVDDGLSPAAVVTGTLDALITAVAKSMESIEKIVATLGGAVPFSAMAAPEGLDAARTTTGAAELPTASEANMVVAEGDSTPLATIAAAPMTVGPAATQDAEDTSTAPAHAEAEKYGDEDAATGDETPNGATDLSDGNVAEPGTTNDGPADVERNDSAITTGEATTAVGASGDQTATTTDSSTGSDEGSGADGDSTGE